MSIKTVRNSKGEGKKKRITKLNYVEREFGKHKNYETI